MDEVLDSIKLVIECHFPGPPSYSTWAMNDDWEVAFPNTPDECVWTGMLNAHKQRYIAVVRLDGQFQIYRDIRSMVDIDEPYLFEDNLANPDCFKRLKEILDTL